MKRKNPDTKTIFKRGDVRKDGARFMRYCTNRPVRGDGFFVEDWQSAKSQFKGIKRINPETGKTFKFGDGNATTGKFFHKYEFKGSDKHGYTYENWVTKTQLEKIKQTGSKASRRRKIVNKANAKTGLIHRRLNPKTDQEYKKGDIDETGRVFITYNSASTTNGFVGEEWGDSNTIMRRQISTNMWHMKRRANEAKISFALSFDYLVSIFPLDSRCPIFGTEMNWLGDKKSSPSLDRIIPKFGYVEGNVAWVSNRANTIKLNRTPEVLRKMADWIEKEIARAKANEKK